MLNAQSNDTVIDAVSQHALMVYPNPEKNMHTTDYTDFNFAAFPQINYASPIPYVSTPIGNEPMNAAMSYVEASLLANFQDSMFNHSGAVAGSLLSQSAQESNDAQKSSNVNKSHSQQHHSSNRKRTWNDT